jgi:CxxC motif-containing protein (DUF1111 family)
MNRKRKKRVVGALAVASVALLSRPCTGQTFSPSGQNAFSLPLSNITRENRRAHVIGNSFFNKNWVTAPASSSARDGLGPLFLARSCSECHLRDGRSSPENPGLLFRVIRPGKGSNGEPTGDELIGIQIATQAIPGWQAEGTVAISYEEMPGRYADGTSYSLRKPTYRFEGRSGENGIRVAPRIASPVFGLGLLEAIPEADLLAAADPDDANSDGISGRPNRVWNPETKRHETGRFGWKANQPDVRQQTATAFVEDIGITSSIHPQESLTESQRDATGEAAAGPEIDEKTLSRVVTYLQTLAPPSRRDLDKPEVQKGEQLFHSAGCARCHIPTWKTRTEVPGFPGLSDQIISPYTDLLLHDMGPGLADDRPDFEATGSEWRTPPLWGIGLTEVVNGHPNFLHDGRARNLEEAILWHGGEAKAAREAFRLLPEKDREDLLTFLNSL